MYFLFTFIGFVFGVGCTMLFVVYGKGVDWESDGRDRSDGP